MKQARSQRRTQIAKDIDLIDMIRSSRSVYEDNDIQNRIDMLPTMSVAQKNILHEILLHEQVKLDKINTKYTI